MALVVVSTPIGNPEDISKHALSAIEAAELVIGEERKVTTKFLKQYGLTGRPVELLNEHSDQQDLDFLLAECKAKQVALISDCGTPGFCDPGADLVDACYRHGVAVAAAPGASSLMTFLSLTGRRLDQFLFRGFLPANNEKRSRAWNDLKKDRWPIILMDTPYRLAKTVEEACKVFPNAEFILGYRLTFEDQKIIRGKASQVQQAIQGLKGEFLLLIING